MTEQYNDGIIQVVIARGARPGLIYFVNRLRDYLDEKKILYYILDIDDPSTYNSIELDRFVKRRQTIMITFNNIGIKLDNHGENFWKQNRIPIIDYLVDHPRYYYDTLLNPPCEISVFSLDKEHVDFVKSYYPKVAAAIFSPNGGTSVGNKIRLIDREIDVLYMGDCNEKIEMFPYISPEYGVDDSNLFYEKTITYMIEDSMLSADRAIEKYLRQHGKTLKKELIFELNHRYAQYIEYYVRRYYQLEGIKALDNLGISVDIYGNYWQDDEYIFSENVKIHGRVSVEEIMDLVGHAKISLCFIPLFKKGCSEKNFDSMLNGAVCLTDRSEYLETNYIDGYNIVYFDLNNLEQMAADAKWLLEHIDAAQSIAIRGFETALMHDTWWNRFDKMFEYAYKIFK